MPDTDYLCPMYAVIDVETTGLKPKVEKITEIAVILTDGKTIEKEWHSLVNPQRLIPAQITRLTGITNDMVAEAPKFYEIAKQIVLLTEGRTFVAHNASFDYNFIKEEFRRLGYDFRRNKKCTVQLSRRLFPKQPSYSLGKLCRSFDIKINARHRAKGDALATTFLFHRILEIQHNEMNDVQPLYIPPAMNKGDFELLPEKTGVYYFYDENNRIIYIGKSLNIKERVKSHFSSADEREQKIKAKTNRIDYKLTGSELLALLLESDEIKKHTPVFNRRQRRQTYNYGLFSYYDDDGYLQLETGRISQGKSPHTTFSTKQEAKEHLRSRVEEFFLCQKLSGLYKSEGACFHYQVHQCLGACIGEEKPETYNMRVNEMLKNYDLQYYNHIIVDEGRSPEEYSIVVLMNGKYRGFGFVPKDKQILRSQILDYVDYHEENKDVRQIIRSYLKKNNQLKIIDL
ncbi:MAG: exonuclease domain-containing protein [Bacteroidales bacterium]